MDPLLVTIPPVINPLRILQNSMPRLRLFCLVCALLSSANTLFSLGGSGSPEIDETKITRIIYTHPTDGDDQTGDGTSGLPFASLAKALEAARPLNAANIGVKISLAPGVYEEGTPGNQTAIFFPELTTSAPLVIEGAGWSEGTNTGDVIISGSTIWDNWENLGNGVFRKPWPHDFDLIPYDEFGASEVPEIVPDVIRVVSGVFVNDEPYYLFESENAPNASSYLKSQEGMFWYDPGSDNTSRGGDDYLHIKLPASTSITDLNSETVHVTGISRVIHIFRDSTKNHLTPVAFRNLVFRHAGSYSILSQNHEGLIYEDLVFHGNKLRGLTSAGRLTIRRCEFFENGEQTLGAEGENLLMEDLHIHNNSRQSYLAGYFGWGIGPFKIGHGDGVTMQRVFADSNWGLGAWFDTGIKNLLFRDSVVINHTHPAIFIENNNEWNIPDLNDTLTVVVENCFIEGNLRPNEISGITPGVMVGETQNSIVRHSYFGNNDTQIRILATHERGPQNNNQFYGNIIGSAASDQPFYYGDSGTGYETWFDSLNE